MMRTAPLALMLVALALLIVIHLWYAARTSETTAMTAGVVPLSRANKPAGVVKLSRGMTKQRGTKVHVVAFEKQSHRIEKQQPMSFEAVDLSKVNERNRTTTQCRLLTYFSGAMCDLWRNLMHTVRTFDLSNGTVSYLLDEGAAACAAAVPMTGIVLVAADVLKQNGKDYSSNISGEVVRSADEDADVDPSMAGWVAGGANANWGSRAFRDITALKLRLLLVEFERTQRECYVLYLDVDVVLMRNVLPELLALPKRDLYLQSDEAHFSTKGVKNFCTGVALIAPTPGAKALLRCALQRASQPTKSKRGFQGEMKFKDDQDALNECVARGGQGALERASWHCGVLDPAIFPNGFRFFKRRALCASIPALVHNNYAIGQRIKRRRFNKTGLWYVGTTAA